MNKKNLPSAEKKTTFAIVVTSAIFASMMTGAILAAFTPSTPALASGSPAVNAVKNEERSIDAKINSLATSDDGKISTIPLQNLPSIIQHILSPEDKVVKSFVAQGGLTAWVIHSPDHPAEATVVYTMDNEQTLIHGRVFSMQGDAITEHTTQYSSRYMPVIDVEAQWQDIAASHWIADGATDDAATRIIYGFFDANCVYCHLAWLALEPYMDKGLQVRWIPVAILGETSGRKAAALYAAENKSEAMRKGHEGWDAGGFPKSADVPNQIQEYLDNNLNLMRNLGMNGTPAFFYRDEQGHLRVVSGMPGLSKSAEMAGMLEIENKNSKLQRFE